MIEAAGGSFQLARCEQGQSADVESYSEVEVSFFFFLDKKTIKKVQYLVQFVVISTNCPKISLKIGNVQQEKEVKEKHEEMTKNSAVDVCVAPPAC